MSEEHYGNVGCAGVGSDLEHFRGGQRGDVDFAGEQEILMRASEAGVLDVDFQVLVGEVAAVLGDVNGDEWQIGLGFEAGHVGHGQHLIGVVARTGEREGGDGRDK